MKAADREALDRRLATAGIAKDELGSALDATIRPGEHALAKSASTTARGGRGATITGPFLPSITLAEAATESTAPPSTTADLLVTTLLGEGGMGIVHMASQRSLDRSVAIKRPTSDSGDGLVEEARTMARVEHPNVVPVYALGRDARDRPVLVMKHIQGASFRELLKDEAHAAWPPLIERWGDRERAALGILGEVADALELAHARRIIHRDVKPENVMVGEFGEVYLLDWGIARRLDEPAIETGNIVGTPGYMAPEMVLESETVDTRTDVYLLGATLHEILTKTLRHRGASLYETLGLAMASEPVAYGQDVPEDLAALANASTSLDRDARPESAAAFRSALRDHERHREALGLVRDARATIEPLLSGAIALADAAALPLLSEAGAALAAARRAFPEGASVRAAREEHLVLSIERDLAIESPAAARAHLAQLSAPAPALEKRVVALEASVARAKASDTALARARAEADTSSASRTRLVVLTAAFGPIVAATLALRTTGLVGGPELSQQSIAVTDGAMIVLLTLGLFLARKRLFANQGNRVLTWYGVAAVAALSASNALGVALGESASRILAHSYVVIATGFLLGGVMLHRLFFVGAATSLCVAMLLGFVPEHGIAWSSAGMAAAAVVSLGGVFAYSRRPPT